jgi:hypothetical protein
MKKTIVFALFTSHLITMPLYAKDNIYTNPKKSLKAGEYLSVIGGCHDCHTPNFAETNGKVPAKDYFVGTPYGFKGPWGVTYPANLRILVNEISLKVWVELLKRNIGKPPMPWVTTNKMSEDDLTAIYLYIKSLGPSGKKVPHATEPGEKAKTPYIYFVPVEGN